MRRRDILEEVAIEIGDAAAAEVRKRAADLLPVEVDGTRRTGFSADRRTPQRRAPDHHELRTERERLDHVAATAKPAVHDDGRA